MKFEMTPIGYVHTSSDAVPRHWTVSNVEGTLHIDEQYLDGLKDIRTRQKIVVLFVFHKSSSFSDRHLTQTPPHRHHPMGVFSICSPRRPNPIGLSVVEVQAVKHNLIYVTGIDMLDGTPIIDIKPHITGESNCPSRALDR